MMLEKTQPDFWNEMIPYFFEGFGIVVGVLAGILAGTFITIWVNKRAGASLQKHLIKTLKIDRSLQQHWTQVPISDGSGEEVASLTVGDYAHTSYPYQNLRVKSLRK